jgi:hypothetical protein
MFLESRFGPRDPLLGIFLKIRLKKKAIFSNCMTDMNKNNDTKCFRITFWANLGFVLQLYSPISVGPTLLDFGAHSRIKAFRVFS